MNRSPKVASCLLAACRAFLDPRYSLRQGLHLRDSVCIQISSDLLQKACHQSIRYAGRECGKLKQSYTNSSIHIVSPPNRSAQLSSTSCICRMKSLPPRIDEAAQKKGIANLTRALIGRRSRRDDVAYGGTPMPQPVAEARQGHFESVNTTDLKPDDIVIAYVIR